MKSKMLWGIGIASVMSIGLIAQTQDPSKSTTAQDRKVTLKGCLERSDSSAMAGTSMAAFTLNQVEVTKDEPNKDENIVKDVAKDTGAAVSDVGKATADAVTFGQTGKDQKDLKLQVAPADATVNLASEVNHKVELVGVMSKADVEALKAKSTPAMTTLPTFKAKSVKSLSDKCN